MRRTFAVGVVFLLIICIAPSGALAGGNDIGPTVGAVPQSLGRATYYVAENGSDGNAGDQDHPFREIRAGIAAASAGTTIIVANGTYKGFDLKKSGSQGSPITIIAPEKNATVIVTSDRPDNRDTIFITMVSWIVIDGLKTYTANRAGIRIDQSYNITVRNCTVGNCGTWGVFTDYGADLLVEWCDIYGSVGEHGIYFSNSVDRPSARNNTIHDNHGCGIHNNGDASMGGDGLVEYALHENNTIYNNAANGGGGAGINMDGGQHCIVRNNVLYNNHASGITNYHGDASSGPVGCEFYHNTIDMPADGRWALQITGTVGKVTVRNNILYSRAANRGGLAMMDANDVANIDSDYNIMDRVTPDDWNTVMTLAQWQQQGHELHSLSAPPSSLWVNATGPDYHLLSNSSAIDKGQNLTSVAADKDGNQRPIGISSDIGAYEYLTPPPPDVTPPGPVIDLAVRDVTLATVNVSWSAPGDNGTVGTAKSYDLRYSKAGITELNWACATKASGLPAPLPAGSPQWFNVTGLASNTTYHFAMKAMDKAGNIAALSNVVNATTLRIRPDLSISPSDITFSGTGQIEGDIVTVGATVRAINVTYNLTYSLAMLVDGTERANSTITQTGATGTAQWNWTATKGDHNITIAIDTTGAIDETNESNNLAVKQISVQERPVPPKPDLYVQASEISFSRGAPIEGDTVSVTARIRGANITQNISFTVDFLVDNAFRESRTPFLNGSMTVVTFPWTALRGLHRFTIAIDPLNAIAESNETNNNASASLTAGGPDLFISQSDLALPGRSPLEGENVTINATVHSENLAISVNVTVEFLVDGVQRGSRAVSIDNSPLTLQFTWTAERGNHTITVKVDSTKVYDEMDETNNEASGQLTVRERPAPPALDLYIAQSDISFGSGTPVEGTVVAITAVVHFVNLTQAMSATVKMSVDGTPVGNQALELAAFSSSRTVAFAWVGVKGVHNITVTVDAGPGVTEPDKTNNAATRSLTVVTKGKPPTPTSPLADNTMLYAAGIGAGVMVAAAVAAMVVMRRRKGREPSEGGPTPLEGTEGGPHP